MIVVLTFIVILYAKKYLWIYLLEENLWSYVGILKMDKYKYYFKIGERMYLSKEFVVLLLLYSQFKDLDEILEKLEKRPKLLAKNVRSFKRVLYVLLENGEFEKVIEKTKANPQMIKDLLFWDSFCT